MLIRISIAFILSLSTNPQIVGIDVDVLIFYQFISSCFVDMVDGSVFPLVF